MSKLLQGAAVAFVLVAAANPAFALNPQPEPPGILKIIKTPNFRKHPAKAAGAARVAQAAAWSTKDVGFQFHGISSVILPAG